MNSKYVLLAIIITLCVVGLYQLTNIGRHEYPEYKVSVGQIADFNLLAPFDFPILKSEEQVQQEYSIAVQKIDTPYSRNPDVEFEAYSNLDKIYELLYESALDSEKEKVKAKARQQGFSINNSIWESLNEPDKILATYQPIRKALEEIYKIGIYERVNTPNITIYTDTGKEKHDVSRYYQLNQVRMEILRKSRIPVDAASLIDDNTEKLIQANIVVNESEYEILKRNVNNSISRVSGTVAKNEEIISKNQRLTEGDIKKLDSLSKEYQNRGSRKSGLVQFLSFMGLMVYILMVVGVFNYFLLQNTCPDIQGITNAIVLNLGLLLLVGLSIININLLHLDSSSIPFALMIISATILVGYDFALLYGVCGIFVISPFINWDAYNIVLLLLSSLVTMSLMHRYRAKHDFLKIWLFLFLSISSLKVVFTFYSYNVINLGESIQSLIRSSGVLLVSTASSVLGCMAIVTFFEKKWKRATKQVLLELLDFNHPLLKKLANFAPGTYHHSLIVGNIAERAAESIGANPLLARVGSYFHDVGKVINPNIYTENNEDSNDLHSQYTTEESAEAIRKHVKDGVVLASKYNIPQAVIDIINQHHGTSYIRYFYDAAQRAGKVSDSSVYKYPGPLPKSREAVLVMLADIVESTTNSRNSSSDLNTLKIIEDTVQRLIREGQFDDAPITLKDLALIKQSIQTTVESIYRKRLDYPEDREI